MNIFNGQSTKNFNPMHYIDDMDAMYHISIRNQVKKLFKNGIEKEGAYEHNVFATEIRFFGDLLNENLKIDFTTTDHSMGGSRQMNKNNFNNEILNIFFDRLCDLMLESVIFLRLEFNFKSLGKSETKIREQFDRYFLLKLEQESPTENFMQIYNHIKNTKYRLFIIKVAENYLNKNLDGVRDIDFICILNNNLVLLMFELNYTDETNRVFNKKYENYFKTQIHSFIECMKSLISGEAKISQIKLFKLYQENTCKLIKVLSRFNIQDSPFNHQNLAHFKNLIDFRNSELLEFNKFRSKITAFLQFCSNFKDIDIELLQKDHTILAKLNIEEQSLSVFCKPTSFLSLGNHFVNHSPHITYFKTINKKKIELIDKFIELDRLRCVIFDHLMNETLEKCKDELMVGLLSVDMLLNDVQEDVFKKWQTIANTIETGRIKLVEIDHYLKQFFGGHDEKIKKELIYIIEKCQIKNLAKRKKEINLYFRFKSSVEIAKIVDDIRVKFGMTNAFPELAELLSISSNEYREWTIEKMDDNVARVIDILKRMENPCKINCLRAFSESKELVVWLRVNLKDIKELKFLIDLASIAKNADSSQAYKKDLLAKVLKESCIAYAPLIFDLKKDDSFSKFIALCDTVWSNLESDKNIAEKLLEVKNKLHILIELKEKKGTCFKL